jgi:hypothetical protein
MFPCISCLPWFEILSPSQGGTARMAVCQRHKMPRPQLAISSQTTTAHRTCMLETFVAARSAHSGWTTQRNPCRHIELHLHWNADMTTHQPKFRWKLFAFIIVTAFTATYLFGTTYPWFALLSGFALFACSVAYAAWPPNQCCSTR